jgi:hypothetical protein
MGIRLAHYLVGALRAGRCAGADRRQGDRPADARPDVQGVSRRHRAGGDGDAGRQDPRDHYLEEWAWRPAAIASYPAGRIAEARANLAWHGILPELGMAVVPRTLTVGSIGDALDTGGGSTGAGGAARDRAFPRFADDLRWWTAAARAQRLLGLPGG